jgi:hypothetical protein
VYLSNKRGECFGDLARPLDFTPRIPLLIKIRLLLDLYFLTYVRGCQVQSRVITNERVLGYTCLRYRKLSGSIFCIPITLLPHISPLNERKFEICTLSCYAFLIEFAFTPERE